MASLVNAGRKMVQDEARGTMYVMYYIMCNDTIPTSSQGVSIKTLRDGELTPFRNQFYNFLEGPGLYIHRYIYVYN